MYGENYAVLETSEKKINHTSIFQLHGLCACELFKIRYFIKYIYVAYFNI